MAAEQLTDLQLEFMRVLWEVGEGTVADVQDRLQAGGRALAPTTVSTVLRRLESQGWVNHRERGRQFIYRAAVSRDDATGNITIRRWADVEPAIDANKAAHLDGDGKTGDMWLAARIPVEVANLWKQLYGIDAYKAEHWPAVRKLLQDPDWRYMRPTTFRL